MKLPKLPDSFKDPITGYAPKDERQMSGLLGYFHQKGRVDWSKVPLLLADKSLSGRTANELLGGALVCSEYPLFWTSKSELDTWGGMPADLIFISLDGRTVVLVENKIGSGFTGEGGDPAVGQLAKQADFLLQSRIPQTSLVLLSTNERFEKGRYCKELLNTLKRNERNKKVDGYLMRWEDVLAAIH